MNIKTSNSATNNKLFLGFWLVLFGTLVLTINWLLLMPVMRGDKLITRLAETEKLIIRLGGLHAEFLLQYDKEDNLFTNRKSITEDGAKSTFGELKNALGYIQDCALVNKPEIASSLDDLTALIPIYEEELNNLFLTSRERGNRNSGIVSRWLALSTSMLNVTNLPDKALVENLYKVKRLEGDYLMSWDVRILEDISLLIEELRNQLSLEEGSIQLQDVDTYMQLTGNLAAIEKRMGHASKQGIIPNLENILEKLPATFNTCRELIELQVAKRRVWWTITRYSVIFLIVSLFLILYFSKLSIIDPLRQIAAFTGRMASGEFPDEAVESTNMPFINDIQGNLSRHANELQVKTAFIRAINQDDLNAQLVLSGNRDALGNELLQLQKKIAETAEKQALNEEENLKRRYMNEGLAKFSEILRSKSNDFTALGDTFIREIVKYLNAIQGGFFVLSTAENSTPVLELVSAFAYNRKKYLQRSIAFGEGLVGTCAREKKYLNLTKIPKGYISITSGLGDTPPNNLLLLPVLHENEVLGVLEIASLSKFRDHEVEFAQEVALSLGSTIVSSRNNHKTSELLTKSQQQALEMAEQEEEMRQNMEELKATQEESNRREEDLSSIVKAVNTALLIIEYNDNGTIREVNDNLCKLIGLSREEIIGKAHQEVLRGTMHPDAHFWDEVRKSGNVRVTETITAGKNAISLTEHFTPVVNRDNYLVKFINIATDE